MAKPSFNKPKFKGPKRDTWDLSDPAVQLEVDAVFALNGDTDYADVWGLINYDGENLPAGLAPIPSIADAAPNYGYVFLSPGTGKTETIDGDPALAGIIASGVGNDTVNAGDLGDLIFLGNGQDTGNGGIGNDIIFGENGKDNLNGNEGNDILSGGTGKDNIAGGTDLGTATVTAFVASDSSGPLTVFTVNPTALADAAVLTPDAGPAGADNELVEEGVFIDTSTVPPTVHHIMSFTPDDPGLDGGVASFTVAMYDADGAFVDAFDVTMTEGSKNFFSFVDNDLIDDGGTISVYAGIGFAGDPALDLAVPLDSEAYEPATLTPTDADIVAGDVLIGGSAPDTFIYNFDGTIYDGVDVITDWGNGDTLQLNGIAEADVVSFEQDGNLILMFTDANGQVVPDAAIQVVGVTDINDLNIVFA